jgi:RNA polymerase primary sigma factor
MAGTQPTRQGATQSPLEIYLRQINATPLLTAEEERDLAYRITEGDGAARDHLVRANLRLVVNIARAYQGKGVDLPDLIAEGNLGLLRAAEAFDAAMETRFSTYAAYWVKQSIRRAVINTSRTIRLPAYMTQWLWEWRKASTQLTDELHRPPTEEEVAGKLQLTPRQLRLVKKAIRIHNGLAPGAQEEEGPLDELMADGRSPAPEAGLMRADDLREVLGLVDKLEQRERTVLRLRFGLDGAEPRTLQEIGCQLDLTRERVRQIEREALARLNEMLLA